MAQFVSLLRRFILACSALAAIPSVASADSVTLTSQPFSTDTYNNIPPPHEDVYDPAHFGIANTIGGYSVFVVLTEDNFVCIHRGEARLIIQSPQPTIDDGPRDFPNALIEQALKAVGFTDSTQWEWTIVGPGVTREQVMHEFDQSYRFFKAHGCPTRISLPSALASPPIGCTLIAGDDVSGGERRCPGSGPGYAIIQNRDLALGDPNTNAQSVNLIAPTVGDNQPLWFSRCDWSKCDWKKWPPCPQVCTFSGGFSALLNNVMTDGNYFLQVGLHFTNHPSISSPFHNPPLPDPPYCPNPPVSDPRNPFSPNGIGTVVFAGAQTDGKGNVVDGDLHARALCVPYIAGHHYYTTISHSTGGPWWTCAADIQDSSTYRCRHHPRATGTYLLSHLQGTNIFVENNATWTQGFPYQWVAYGAMTYINGIGHPWSNEAKWTEHSCDNNGWPVAQAIVEGRGFTKLDGYAFFNIGSAPLYCD